MARISEKDQDYAPLLGDPRDGFDDSLFKVTQPIKSWTAVCKHPLTIINLVLLCASMGFFSLTLFLSGSYDARWGLQKASFYSPLFDLLNVKFVNTVVAAPLFAEDSLSAQDQLLRSSPSDEVDAAWKRVTEVGIVTISTDDVVRLGKDPSTTVKAPKEWGFGSDAHLAQIDGQHALHCLNAVRRYAYREHYFPELNKTSDGLSPHKPWDQAHLSHCLHVLLQTLTCNPSMDIITHNWMETQDFPFPDFAIQKKCVDHSQILDWQSKNKLSTAQWSEIAKRGPNPGDTIVSMPPKLKEWAYSDEDPNA